MPHVLKAQDEIERQMDEVKMDESMVFGEDFNEDKSIAYNNALLDLLNVANEVRAEKGCDALGVPDIQTVVQELVSKNKERYYVVVYMPIDRLLSITRSSRSEVVSQFAPAPSLPAGNSATSSPAGQSSGAPDRSGYAGTSMSSPFSNEVLETLCNQDNWTEIKGFLSGFKNRGLIKETGYGTSPADVPADAYTILIDEMYGILAILSPKNAHNRINHRTNNPDSETNYSNCKVIVWYR